jgi:hypothetical protein
MHTHGFDGIDREAAWELIEELAAHATQDRFTYYHRWQVGDLLMWDERATIHRGAGDSDPAERRVMLRTDRLPKLSPNPRELTRVFTRVPTDLRPEISELVAAPPLCGRSLPPPHALRQPCRPLPSPGEECAAAPFSRPLVSDGRTTEFVNPPSLTT